MNLEEAKRLSNVKVITAAYLLAGLNGQQELNPSRWPALVSHFIDEIKKRTGADWLSMPKGAYEKGDSVSRESITQSEFLQLLADYPVQSATAHPQAAAPAPVADSASDAPACDFSMLATRDQLIEAFGRFTNMDASWFNNLKDTPALLNARKVAGQGGRGHIAEPWFCPFEVMQWLADSKRRKGRKMSSAKAWELLEKNFPKVYNARSVADPRAGD